MSALRQEDEDLVLLPNAAMRARRRPFAVAGVWLWESALALALAWPAAAIVRAMYGDHPKGDAPLWEPGGLELAALVVKTSGARAALGATTLVVVLVAAFVGLVPLGALLASMTFAARDRRAPRLAHVLARALRSFRALALLFIVASLTIGAFLLAGLGLGAVLAAALANRLGEARADQLGMVVAGLFVLFTMALGVLHDLSRAGAVRFQVGGWRALKLGWNAWRSAPLGAPWAWTWRSLAALLPLAVGAGVSHVLGGRGGLALVALFVVHQAVVAARVALRASWLAWALRAVDRAHRVVQMRAPSPPGGVSRL